jgi:peroxiredoxin
VPEDDGAADHLAGLSMPPFGLASTAGGEVRLDQLAGRSVVFAYPRTGVPGEEPLGGEAAWNAIPGARGCTPQACAIRDLHSEFTSLGVGVFGLSTQASAYQREAAERLHLPYPLLSDSDLQLTSALRLPSFQVEGQVLLRRLTLFVEDGRITGAQYPVFPPTAAADEALRRLRELP